MPAYTESGYPGETTARDEAGQLCKVAANAFVGTRTPAASIDLSFIYPSELAWDTGHHKAICILYDTTGDFTGDILNH